MRERCEADRGDTGPGGGLSREDSELAERIRAVTSRMARRMRARSGGPPPLRHAVLVELATRGSLRQSELVRVVGVAAPTISRVVTALLEAGLVEQLADPDGRCRRIAVSDEGRATLLAVAARDAARLQRQLTRLDAEQHEAILAAIPLLEGLAAD